MKFANFLLFNLCKTFNFELQIFSSQIHHLKTDKGNMNQQYLLTCLTLDSSISLFSSLLLTCSAEDSPVSLFSVIILFPICMDRLYKNKNHESWLIHKLIWVFAFST